MRVDAPLPAQPVSRPVSGDAEVRDVDDTGQRVEAVRRLRAAEVVPVVDVHPLDLLDRGPDVRREAQGRPHERLAAQGHLPPPAVETREDQYRGTGRAQQIGPHAEQCRRHQIAPQMEHRALLETTAHLVDAGHTDVGPRVHRPGRQIGVEGQMRAPRLVHDQREPAPVAHLRDRLQRRGGAVRGRAGHQGATGVRMGLEGTVEADGRRRVRDMPPGVPPRLHPHRLDPGQDQPRHHRLVGVPPDQQLLVRTGDRQHRRLDRQGTPARAEERVLRVHRVGHQLLGLLEHPSPGEPVVQAARRQHIAQEHGVTQHLAHRGVGTPGLLVPGRGEAQPPLAVVVLKRLQRRCPGVIDRHAPRVPGGGRRQSPRPAAQPFAECLPGVRISSSTRSTTP